MQCKTVHTLLLHLYKFKTGKTAVALGIESSVMFELAVILRGNLCGTWDVNNVSFLQDADVKYVHFLKIQWAVLRICPFFCNNSMKIFIKNYFPGGWELGSVNRRVLVFIMLSYIFLCIYSFKNQICKHLNFCYLASNKLLECDEVEWM